VGDKPIVVRPPNLILPNLANGTENVVTFGTNSRMTITSSGLSGNDIFADLNSFSFLWGCCCRISMYRCEYRDV
jgi:hypothetical protein